MEVERMLRKGHGWNRFKFDQTGPHRQHQYNIKVEENIIGRANKSTIIWKQTLHETISSVKWDVHFPERGSIWLEWICANILKSTQTAAFINKKQNRYFIQGKSKLGVKLKCLKWCLRNVTLLNLTFVLFHRVTSHSRKKKQQDKFKLTR